MEMDILLAVIAGILLLIGLIGTVVPVIPGPPLAWSGLLVGYFSSYTRLSVICLIITGIIAVFISIVDNLFPAFMTKKIGGSKYATIGSMIGLFVGFIAAPISILAGAFLGAFIGELIHSNGEFAVSLKAAAGAFLGFILSTGLKMIIVSIYIMIFIFSIIK